MFTSEAGTPLDPSHVRRDFREAIKGASGIDITATAIMVTHGQDIGLPSSGIGRDSNLGRCRPLNDKNAARVWRNREVHGRFCSERATLAFVIWKACSSIVHGELRGMIAYLKHRPVGATAAGMQLHQVEGNVDLVVTGGLVAIATTRRAFELYRMRAGSQISI